MSKEESTNKKYQLDKLLVSEIRFFIMTLLTMYDEVDFNFLKKELDVTDGNLGVQLRKLEDAEYLTAHKAFVDRKPRTTYTITDLGAKQLKSHIDNISQYKDIL